MYPKARQTQNEKDRAETNLSVKKEGIDITDSANIGFDGVLAGCQCDIRRQDEEEKENMMAEVHITYERILQLEQALIELDEQNTTNTLEIRKREAKMVFIMRQVEELDEL